MKHKVIELLLCLVCACAALFGDCRDHSTRHTSNDFTQTVRLDLPPIILSDNSAASVFGEVGRHNYRVNGTYGFYFNPSSRIKFTGEFLRQRLGYNFTTGSVHRWLGQYAAGAQFEYLLNCSCYIKSFDLGAYYSRAQSKNLSTIVCPITSEGEPNHQRHIAGSNASNFTIGLTLTPWCNATLRLEGDYDFVKYRRENHHDQRTYGGGGSVEFSQVFCRDFNLNLVAQVRRPFDYYGGKLNWRTCTSCGSFLVGVFGGYTKGHEHLPDSMVAGIELGFWFDGICISNPCCYMDPCCETYGYPCPSIDRCDLVGWVSEPAVYVPQVLAIADGFVTNNCVLPTSTPIGDRVIADDEVLFNIDVSPFFTNPEGTALTFSGSGFPNGDGYFATIDPQSGIITGVNGQQFDITFRVTVTATSACGTTSQSFNLTLLAPVE